MALASRGLREQEGGLGPADEATAARMKRSAKRLALISLVTAAVISGALVLI